MVTPVSELFDPTRWNDVDGFAEFTDITYHHDTTGRIARVAFNRPEV
ncbi:MAG: 1,4-dihydroxy-2-naphthoyl-CoA synthase, partial [Pseudolysinimonas sp.]